MIPYLALQVYMQKIITILGPTASGKSELTIRLAQNFGGAIISADSRQIYKNFDIGSGKVTPDECKSIQHYLLDVKELWENYSVAEFQKDAIKVLKRLEKKDTIPFLVGGTGLYLEAVVYDYRFRNVDSNSKLRQSLSKLNKNDLQQKLIALNPNHKLNNSDWNNPVRLIRAIEILQSKTDDIPTRNINEHKHLIIGLKASLTEIKSRITRRVDYRLKRGAILETKQIIDILSKHLSPTDLDKKIKQLGLGTLVMANYINKKIDYDTMRNKYIQAEYQYARRQLTWFRRMNNVVWLDASDENLIKKSTQLVTNFLR